MLQLLDESLSAFLRAEVPLRADDVDLSFEAPDDDWGAAVTKPTINLFLWDVRRNFEERQSGLEVEHLDDGRPVRRMPRPRVDCSYLITAWGADARDEHRLLGQVLGCLLRVAEIEEEYLAGAYAEVRPIPRLDLAAADRRDETDFWSSLGGTLKPGLDLVVTATVDTGFLSEVGPPVERVLTDLRDLDDTLVSSSQRVGGVVAGDDPGELAGTVLRSPRGHARVDDEGRFVVRADDGDVVVVEAEGEPSGEVPEQGLVEPATSRRRRRRR